MLATGREVRPGHWVARAVRDFAVAVGPFVVATRMVDAPNSVRLTVGAPPGEHTAAEAFADRAPHALTALTAFSERFGRSAAKLAAYGVR